MVSRYRWKNASELEAALKQHAYVPEMGVRALDCCSSPHGGGMMCARWPCMQGCMELLRRYSVPISGKRAVVLGRSNIVGMPVAHLLQVRPCGYSVPATLLPSAHQQDSRACAMTRDVPSKSTLHLRSC